MSAAHGYAATAPDALLVPIDFERRSVGANDVEIEVLFCGVCHSDLHLARGEWGATSYPLVPGHEMVGRVAQVGSAVRGFAAGDLAAVGCMVDSCGHCRPCRDGLEQYCEDEPTWTYGSVEKQTGRPTAGGYSSLIVVDEGFVLHLAADVDLAGTAPILCAGITVYSPLRHWQAGPGSRVGIVGVGGLGHMGVKLASALGAEVAVFTTSPAKAEAARSLGADEVVISTDPEQMKSQASSLDLIVNTVAAPHDLDPYMQLLRVDGTMVLVGIPPEPHSHPGVGSLIDGRRSLAGSGIGGIAETQELLDLCAEKGITADVELIPIQEIDAAWDRLARGDVRFRFVIEMSSLAA